MNSMRIACVLLLLVASASAQSITMKDGKVINAKSIRRQGDTILATVELPVDQPLQPGQPAPTGEFGYPIAQIATIDFPEPPQLKAATDLIINGKAADALTQLEPILTYYQGIRDAPGSWWSGASLLNLEALASLGRDDEVEQLATDLAHTATDPETVRAANSYVAAEIARKGDPDKALQMYNAILKDTTQPRTIAMVAVDEGRIYLARKDWEQALLSFLQVPVFYPQQKILMPRVLLGCGRAYVALGELDRAQASLGDLTASYGSSPEAAQAGPDLEKIARLEKTNEPKK